jgi:hypothetical protein
MLGRCLRSNLRAYGGSYTAGTLSEIDSKRGIMTDIKDTYGNSVGRISGNEIRDLYGNVIYRF